MSQRPPTWRLLVAPPAAGGRREGADRTHRCRGAGPVVRLRGSWCGMDGAWRAIGTMAPRSPDFRAGHAVSAFMAGGFVWCVLAIALSWVDHRVMGDFAAPGFPIRPNVLTPALPFFTALLLFRLPHLGTLAGAWPFAHHLPSSLTGTPCQRASRRTGLPRRPPLPPPHASHSEDEHVRLPAPGRDAMLRSALVRAAACFRCQAA